MAYFFSSFIVQPSNHPTEYNIGALFLSYISILYSWQWVCSWVLVLGLCSHRPHNRLPSFFLCRIHIHVHIHAHVHVHVHIHVHVFRRTYSFLSLSLSLTHHPLPHSFGKHTQPSFNSVFFYFSFSLLASLSLSSLLFSSLFLLISFFLSLSSSSPLLSLLSTVNVRSWRPLYSTDSRTTQTAPTHTYLCAPRLQSIILGRPLVNLLFPPPYFSFPSISSNINSQLLDPGSLSLLIDPSLHSFFHFISLLFSSPLVPPHPSFLHPPNRAIHPLSQHIHTLSFLLPICLLTHTFNISCSFFFTCQTRPLFPSHLSLVPIRPISPTFCHRSHSRTQQKKTDFSVLFVPSCAQEIKIRPSRPRYLHHSIFICFRSVYQKIP